MIDKGKDNRIKSVLDYCKGDELAFMDSVYMK